MMERASLMRYLAILFSLVGGSEAVALSLLMLWGKMVLAGRIVYRPITCTHCPLIRFPPSLDSYQLTATSLWMFAGLTGILSVLLFVASSRFAQPSGYLSLISALGYLIGWGYRPVFQQFNVVSYQVYALLEIGPVGFALDQFSILLLTPIATLATGGIIALYLGRSIITSHGHSVLG